MESMDYKLLKKINDLAESLKSNRIAANMDEAVDMAKNMLTKSAAGQTLSPDMLKEMESSLEQDNKELGELAKDAKALDKESSSLEKQHGSGHADTKKFTESTEKTAEHIHALKEDLDSISDIKEDSKAVADKEEEAYEQEELSKKKLPGEDHTDSK